MAVDYRQQYRPEELEPFFPNEIVKMTISVLCTLAILMFFAVLPVLLEMAGMKGGEQEQPANPRGATPVGIKPEWYFLATYQYLRLMPTQFLGISGKTWGVLSQGALVTVVVLLPFWYRRRANRPAGWIYKLAVTVVTIGFLVLTIWGGWPEEMHDGHERLVPLGHYFRHHPMIFLMSGASLIVFYLLYKQEKHTIEDVLDQSSRREQEPGEEVPR